MAQQQMVNLPGQAGGGLPYGSLPQGQLSSGLVSQFPQAAGTPGFQAPSLMQQQQQQIQYQHLQQQQQQQQLQLFWQQQMQEVEQATDFKNHQLPLARIKKIMKADEDVRMISAEAPVVFSKACEMFILELTLRSWIHTEENKRRTLQKNDIAGAISRTDIFDFLVDIVPRDELKEEGLGVPRAQVPIPGAELSYGGMYYMPQAPGSAPSITAPGVVPPSMMVGQPVAGLQLDATGAGAYSQPRAPMPPYMPQGMTPQMWPQQGLPGNLPPQ